MVRQTSRLIESHRGRPGKVSEGQFCTLGKTLAFNFDTTCIEVRVQQGAFGNVHPYDSGDRMLLPYPWVSNSYGQAERDPCAPVFEQTLRP